MFKSKYIFETQQTKYKRYFKNILLLLCIFLVCYLIFCGIFIAMSKEENNISTTALFKRPPDLIVVFTGQTGRIPYAIKKASEYKQTHLFITGVYSKNSVKTILGPMQIPEPLDSNQFEIDYQARNTLENVISTYRYLRQNSGLKRILVVSHDYHLMRIKLLFNTMRSPQDNYEFYYSGVNNSYDNIRNYKILIKEAYKLIRTYLFLMMWENEVIQLPQ